MYKLSENKISGFLYSGSQLMDKEGHTLEFIAKCNRLYLFYDIDEEEDRYLTHQEIKKLYGIAPRYYYCEFAHGKNSCSCKEWQEIGSQRYLQLPAWEAVAGAMDWLKWDEMEEEEKESIFIKLWRSDHILIGIFSTEEIEEISCGEYEPWGEL